MSGIPGCVDLFFLRVSMKGVDEGDNDKYGGIAGAIQKCLDSTYVLTAQHNVVHVGECGHPVKCREGRALNG